LLCAWWLVCNAAAAPPVPPDTIAVSADYVLRVWETDDGLPQNTVTGITQTADGYLWVATKGGLTRFDGVRFTPFFKGTTPALESSYARAVAKDRTAVFPEERMIASRDSK